MLYLANASSARVRDAMTTGQLAQICTPNEGRAPLPGVKVGFDNGCFSPRYVGDERWLAWLVKNAKHAPQALFATAPDVVGDAVATLARSAPFLPVIRELGYPAALVAQNGLTPDVTPWDAFDCLFVGGATECLPCGYVNPSITKEDRERKNCPRCCRLLTEWKLSKAAYALVVQAKARGKRAHMGRVNSHRRWSYAEYIGCDHVDGTFVKFGPDTNLPRLTRWITQAGFDFGEAS